MVSKFVEENLDPKDQGRVRYITSEGIIEFLDGLGKFTPTEQVVRGYKVRTVQQATDSEDVASRRKAISEVIARSLQKGKEKWGLLTKVLAQIKSHIHQIGWLYF